MKKTILTLLLAAMSTGAMAEWVRVGETASRTFYTNPATIRTNGNLRRAWFITDLKQRQNNGEMSRQVLYEFDCKEERFRMLSMSLHSESMAGGRVLESGSPPDEWHYVPPESTVASMLETVCRK